MASSPAPKHSEYDLVVLGSGPGGVKAAVEAAKFGKQVLLIEKDRIGGACIHTGTIPSKTLKEAAQKTYIRNPNILAEVMHRKQTVIREEQELIEEQLDRNHVEWILGEGSFLSPFEIQVDRAGQKFRVKTKFAIIAVGTHPVRPETIAFDDAKIFDSDTILNLQEKPSSMVVVGAGVIGSEYASIFARLGVQVTLTDPRDKLLGFMDPEVIEALLSHFQEAEIELLLGAKFDGIKRVKKGRLDKVLLNINGKERMFDALLYCMGRNGNTRALGLSAAGIAVRERDIISVNNRYQTSVPHIYAVGDVIGSPGLASASAEQGRLAAAHAFKVLDTQFPESFPYGIYTIPEISCVGAQEKELQEKKIPYVTGRAKYLELARGKILGEEHGFLKLIFDRSSMKLLGVHIIGTGATELIHIGQAAFILGGGIDYFMNNVFNYPTLAEAYKVAAYRAYNKLRGVNPRGIS